MKKLTVIIIALVINFNVYANDTVKVPILLYHNITSSIEIENPLVNITPEDFRTHISTLKEAGFEGITFEQYYNYVNEGAPIPEKPIIITFDDGYASNYEYAYPVLKEFGMKSTIFIVTSTVGAAENVNFPHFTWDQAHEMEQSGLIDIQSHSHLHNDMATVELAELIRDIRLSKYLIETNLNKKCTVFAYPYGSYTDFSLQAAAAAGYKMQCRVGDVGHNTKSTPINLLRRITVQGSFSPDELLETIAKNLQQVFE